MTTIYHQVWINAPVTAVYASLATAEGVSRWWDRQTATRVDGAVVLEHDPGPEHGVVRLKVLDLTADRRVEWECVSTHPRSSPASAWTGTRITFALTPRGQYAPARAAWATAVPAQTIPDFRHAGWDERSEYLGFCSFAWAEVLQKLQQQCERSGSGRNDP